MNNDKKPDKLGLMSAKKGTGRIIIKNVQYNMYVDDKDENNPISKDIHFVY